MCIIAIGHEELGAEETPEPAPVEGSSYKQDQGKPWYI
jgi:hypothetical protein